MKFMRTLSFCALWLASPAFAQTADVASERLERAIVIEGSAPRACTLKVPRASGERNTTLAQTGSGGVTVALTPSGFIDPATGVPRATGIELALPITCNTAHHLRVTSTRGGLLREGGGDAGGTFRARLDFAVDVRWAGQAVSFDTGTAARIDLSVADAATGDAMISISIPGGGSPLAAGDYGDTLIIEIEASS